eukprot:1158076-Pelagomonas_calceolata.AAC.4
MEGRGEVASSIESFNPKKTMQLSAVHGRKGCMQRLPFKEGLVNGPFKSLAFLSCLHVPMVKLWGIEGAAALRTCIKCSCTLLSQVNIHAAVLHKR